MWLQRQPVEEHDNILDVKIHAWEGLIARARVEINVGSRRQLLFDDFFLALGNGQIEDYAHNILWTLGKVRKDPPRNLLLADQPTETGLAWVCVLHDGGRYRLWYNASHPSRWGLFVSYAESNDATHLSSITLTGHLPEAQQERENPKRSNHAL